MTNASELEAKFNATKEYAGNEMDLVYGHQYFDKNSFNEDSIKTISKIVTQRFSLDRPSFTDSFF